jgi:hypothetical protein
MGKKKVIQGTLSVVNGAISPASSRWNIIAIIGGGQLGASVTTSARVNR